MGLSDCAANRSHICRPFSINIQVMNSGWTSNTPSIPNLSDLKISVKLTSPSLIAKSTPAL